MSTLTIVGIFWDGIDIQLPGKGRERERAFNGIYTSGGIQLHQKIFQKLLIKYRLHRERDLFNREEDLHHFYFLAYPHAEGERVGEGVEGAANI